MVFASSMRNLPDESSVAQSLDDECLTGSLAVPGNEILTPTVTKSQ